MSDFNSLVATYRLQLTPSFGLNEAAAIVPYLARLGISHVYTSSYLRAGAGSNHGYDTTSHAHVSEELGGEEALVAFHRALRAHGMGNVVDVVPNHMSVADPTANTRWWNVLRDGPTSADAKFFDIDWSAPEHKLVGRVLLPVLARDYAAELADHAIELVHVEGALEIRYGELRFPLARHTKLDARALTRPSDLHEVLEQQYYRLACWRVGRDEINYRRFFDVTTLAGVRVEDPAVFEAVHHRTLQWVRSGDVQGLRIDHPDGLRDPTGYLQELRRAAPDSWIVVEKILQPGEQLPDEWPVNGTTGYDTMRKLTALFVDPLGEPTLTLAFNQLSGDWRPYEDQLIESKRLVLEQLFGAEVTRLSNIVGDVCEASVIARDFSRHAIRTAVVALLAATPVYRTYVSDRTDTGSGPHVSAQDDAVITRAVDDAKRIQPDVDPALFDYLGRLLRGQPGTPTVRPSDLGELIARFQQLSGPATAKGIEDTLFYRFNRLVTLNEVGADPSRFGMSVAEFHADMTAAATTSPLSMTATSTHDTKRSEDVRARIALLSEVPDEWFETLYRWAAINYDKWGSATPDRRMEHLLYQTLFGAHPLSTERAVEFLRKAVREAKQTSSWLHPSDFEEHLFAFASALEADPVFQAELQTFVDQFAEAGRTASLSQLLLKATIPGIPDFYQGSELWTTSLVDPDNRGEVDYAERMRLLEALNRGEDTDDRAHKLWLTRRLLKLRRARPTAFVGPAATYEPLQLTGARADDAIAFVRGGRAIVVAPVRPVALMRNGWGDTSLTLPQGTWIDALSGANVESGGSHVDRIALEQVNTFNCVVLVDDASR